MLPSFVVLGAQKSASTYIQQCLLEHPDIYMPQKETPFFENPAYLQTSIESFESLFKAVPEDKCIGIKCPSYLGSPECPERIAKHLNDVKLIVVLRNPVERAISAYFWYMYFDMLPIEPLEEGIKNILDESYREKHRAAKDILDFGFYHKHLIHYLQHFERNRILILLDNEIKVDPLKVVKSVYQFLEVDDDYIPKSLNKSSNTGIYSLERIKFLNMRNYFTHNYYLGKSRVYSKKKSLLDLFLYSLIYLTDKVLVSKIYPNTKPSLSHELKVRLFEIYRTDIQALETLLSRDLSSWKLNNSSL